MRPHQTTSHWTEAAITARPIKEGMPRREERERREGSGNVKERGERIKSFII
jgi:hypothetical protein